MELRNSELVQLVNFAIFDGLNFDGLNIELNREFKPTLKPTCK